jgi:hypothetical protein
VLEDGATLRRGSDDDRAAVFGVRLANDEVVGPPKTRTERAESRAAVSPLSSSTRRTLRKT